jgi:hypothetical protein
MKALLPVWIMLALFLTLIFTGLFPRYTEWCPNGRIVYLQDGHQDDKDKLCKALDERP